VLSAVFVPCAFISGITGQFFRQFALTIAVSTIISAFNSLTLSPALAAILLQPRGAKKDMLGRMLEVGLGWFFRLFNWGFRTTSGIYGRVVGLALRGSVLVLVVYGGLLTLTWWTSEHLPSGYIPNQDQGRFYIAVQLPDAASVERSQQAVDHITEVVGPMPGVAHTTGIAGQSFTLNANGSNFAQFFVSFEEFDKRRDPSLSAKAITDRVRKKLDEEIPEASILILTPPPVSGLGSGSGFKIIIEDRNDLGPAELQSQIERIIERSKESDKVENLFSVHRAHIPQLYVDLDRDQCQSMAVDPNDVFSTLQIYLGSFYINDFNKFGRTWQVIVQAEGEFRDDPERVKRLMVRSARDNMVPLGSLLTIKELGGPINIGRYNMYPAAAILGSTKPGVSTGQGIEEMERICAEVLSPGMAFEWTEINYMQVDASKNIWNNLIFPLAVAFVFLVLAAQYESWALPLAVILVVPMCILGSLTGVWVTNGDINIFTQIGFVVLVGLASKNAILIVEFAKHKREDAGLPRREATLAACRLRLRPILMTSFAFILGVVPLLVGRGAGAEMRRVLGVAVFSGMIGVTMFGIFLTPVFFYVIEGFVEQPLFSSARTRRIGETLRLTLGVLTGGLFWLPALLMRGVQRRRGVRTDARRRPPVLAGGPPATNGGPAITGNGEQKAPDGVAAARKPEDVKME
jgi:multidrug efflux pump